MANSNIRRPVDPKDVRVGDILEIYFTSELFSWASLAKVLDISQTRLVTEEYAYIITNKRYQHYPHEYYGMTNLYSFEYTILEGDQIDWLIAVIEEQWQPKNIE